MMVNGEMMKKMVMVLKLKRMVVFMKDYLRFIIKFIYLFINGDISVI